MPTATSSPAKSSAQGGSSLKLRQITPAAAEAWTALYNPTASNFKFIDLDEPYEYPFKVCKKIPKSNYHS